MPEEILPEGWNRSTLENLIIHALGGEWGKSSSDDDPEELVPVRVVRNTEFKKWADEKGSTAALRYIKRRSLEKRRLLPGDLVIEISGGGPKQPVGRTIMIDNEAITRANNPLVCSNFCRQVRLSSISSPAYVSNYLSHLHSQGDLDKFQKSSTNIRNLTFKSFIKGVAVPLPPLPEQKRIVAKLDEIMAEIKAAKEHLARVKELIRRFQQSVLNAAVTGKLTEGHPVDKWNRIKLIDLIPDGGVFDGPFGSNLKTADYTDSGVRVIRLENIGWMSFDDSKKTFISEDKYQTLQRHTVGEGDIIFSSFIGDEVRACVLPSIQIAIAKADCFCLRPRLDVVNRQYLVYSFSSVSTHTDLMTFIHGATRPRINLTQLKGLEVRLPSLSTQEEIVNKISDMFDRSRKVEMCLDSIPLDLAIDSVLSKAFKGELVYEIRT